MTILIISWSKAKLVFSGVKQIFPVKIPFGRSNSAPADMEHNSRSKMMGRFDRYGSYSDGSVSSTGSSVSYMDHLVNVPIVTVHTPTQIMLNHIPSIWAERHKLRIYKSYHQVIYKIYIIWSWYNLFSKFDLIFIDLFRSFEGCKTSNMLARNDFNVGYYFQQT